MESQLELLWSKMKEEMKQQTTTINQNVATTMDEKLKPLVEETALLRLEVETLKAKTRYLEKDARKNNLILHGVPETENNFSDLMGCVIKTLDIVSGKAGMESWDKWEINNVYRLGKKSDKKTRPIFLALTLLWRKVDLLKNKKHLPNNIYVTEDYPKEVLLKRKELKIKLQEELDKGNEAYIVYDRLVIKEKNEKRKRSPTQSPNSEAHKIPDKPKPKMSKVNAFNKLRSFSLSEGNKTYKN